MATWRHKFDRRVAVGVLLFVLAFLSYPALQYYFGNFYNGSWDDFKSWYPRLHFLIFPLVKSLPFLFFALIFLLIRQPVSAFLSNALQTLRALLQHAGNEVSEKKKTASAVTALFFSNLKRLTLNFLLLCTTLCIIVFAAEYALRAFGLKAGYRIYSQYFTPVDSLYLLKGFIADSNGIFCVSPDAREFIRNELATKNSAEELLPLDKLQSTEVYTLPKDYLALRKSEYKSAFKNFLETTGSPTDTTDQNFFNAVQEYVKCPINENGFKSIPFKKFTTKKKSILLLGDSFTWGHSSSNKTNSFADLLLAKGFVVYNTGITGTDPAQYLQIAKVLVPQLQPDYVVVNFYMGNDIVFFERKPEPHVPVFYCTNAGNIISCPEGIYFYDAQRAYEHTLSVFMIPAGNNSLNKFCSKTVLGTLIWRLLAKFHLVDAMLHEYVDYYEQVRKLTTPTPYSDTQLQRIKDITEQSGGKFLLTVIPSIDGSDFLYPEEKQPLFIGLDYHVPPVSKKHYLQQVDGHYNDLGHAMHAAFIDSLIKATSSN